MRAPTSYASNRAGRLAARPRLTELESRALPGSLLATGLDLSGLAGVFGESPPRPPAAHAIVQQPVHTPSAPPGGSAEPNPGTGRPPPSVGAESVPRAALADGPETPAGLHVPALSALAGLTPERPGGGGYGSRANSNTNFYGGDFDGRNGLADENGTAVTDAKTFDDIHFRGAWDNACVFGRYLMSTTATALDVTILGPGQAQAGVPNGGLPVAYSATNIPLSSVAPTGSSGFGYTEYQVTSCLVSIPPLQGHYYLSVQVVGNGSGQAFISTTSGANGRGSPIANGDSWFSSTYFGYTFTKTSDILGSGTWDFSQGLCIKTSCP
jgi:hypothetical protein